MTDIQPDAEAKHGPTTIDLAAIRDLAASVQSGAAADSFVAMTQALALAALDLASQVELLAAQRSAAIGWCKAEGLEPWMLAAEIRKVYAEATRLELLEDPDGSVHVMNDLAERLRQELTEIIVFAGGDPDRAPFRIRCDGYSEVGSVLAQAPHAGVATRRTYVTAWDVAKEPSELARPADRSAATETSSSSGVAPR